MREIKFRAMMRGEHPGHEGNWAYIVGIGHDQWHSRYGKYYGGINWETRSQFTGLLDKNGKEIYEGDIITHRYVPVYVVEDIVDFLISVGDGDHWEGMLTNEWEVIGNIYENTELLEKK